MNKLLILLILIIQMIVSKSDYIQFDVNKNSNESLEPYEMNYLPKDFFKGKKNLKYIQTNPLK